PVTKALQIAAIFKPELSHAGRPFIYCSIDALVKILPKDSRGNRLFQGGLPTFRKTGFAVRVEQFKLSACVDGGLDGATSRVEHCMHCSCEISDCIINYYLLIRKRERGELGSGNGCRHTSSEAHVFRKSNMGSDF